MKILHLCQLYYPAIGGVEALAGCVSEQLVKRGHELTVFTSNAINTDEFHRLSFKPGALKKQEIINGVKVRRFDLNPWKGFFFSSHTDQFKGGYRLQKLLAGESMEFLQHGPVLDGLMGAIKGYNPELIVAFNNYPMTSYVGYLAKKRLGIPLLIFPSSHTADPWAFSTSLKELYRLADGVIASTSFEKEYLIKLGVLESKIYIVPLAIDHHQWLGSKDQSFRQKHQIPVSATVVTYIGRQIHGKGIEVLVDAMRLVWRQFPSIYLILAGKVSESFKTTINERLAQLLPKERLQLIYLDSFKDEDKKSMYDASDLYVMASKVDSFGLVYLEAWACGVPVIACRNTAQESIIEHGKDGYLIDYGSDVQLAEGIKIMLNDNNLRRTMGESGRQKVLREHTLDVCTNRLLAIYSATKGGSVKSQAKSV